MKWDHGPPAEVDLRVGTLDLRFRKIVFLKGNARVFQKDKQKGIQFLIYFFKTCSLYLLSGGVEIQKITLKKITIIEYQILKVTHFWPHETSFHSSFIL